MSKMILEFFAHIELLYDGSVIIYIRSGGMIIALRLFVLKNLSQPVFVLDEFEDPDSPNYLML